MLVVKVAKDVLLCVFRVAKFEGLVEMHVQRLELQAIPIIIIAN
jgi:hypothetical protein